MAQPLSLLDPLTKDLSSVPSTHIEWHTATYNSSSMGFGALLWPLEAPVLIYTYTHAVTHRYQYTQKINKINL